MVQQRIRTRIAGSSVVPGHLTIYSMLACEADAAERRFSAAIGDEKMLWCASVYKPQYDLKLETLNL